ncbi:hypothetical protein KZX43_08610 [Microbacterium sp. EYE_512]|uniref:Reductase C-terminal domain-containing protein n=1 Tax=Microbacterium wangchenii TaxID=2541726 RepID=A0ABX5SMY2_9MICO|nr:hypothetical protein [Microbacterium sp. EYE_512]QBR87491.1 hypothetical protein E4K62_01520 [Microbacterium wangchenii]TXK14813.1 hypothetical protein FVP99_14105 [Microbacterium wangchenii]
MQIAGIARPSDSEILLAPTRESGLAVAREREGNLVAVETVNDPKIHLKARRLLAQGAVSITHVEELAPGRYQSP